MAKKKEAVSIEGMINENIVSVIEDLLFMQRNLMAAIIQRERKSEKLYRE